MSIRRDLEKMQRAFMSGNLDEFISHMDRMVIEENGGVENVKNFVGKQLSKVLEKIDETSSGEISAIVKDGETLAAVIPALTRYTYPTGKFVQHHYRIASSRDAGKTWQFLDGQGRGDQEALFREKFPVLTRYVPFPECKHEISE